MKPRAVWRRESGKDCQALRLRLSDMGEKPEVPSVREKQIEPMMFRALLRLVSMIFLSVAVIMAVLDATRSIAAEAVVLTPLASSWAAFSPATLEQFRLVVTGNLPDFVWSGGIASLLALPGFAIFAAIAFLLALAGRRSARTSARIGIAG